MYLKPWCLSNGWKCMHDTIHCMTYWTMTWSGTVGSWNLRLLQKTMMSWSVVSNSPLLSLHRSLPTQQHLRTPWQRIRQFDVSSTAVSTCMHDGVLYYFMHWVITSEMSFVRILVDQTTLNWRALLIALVYQYAHLLLLITTGPNSVGIYSLTRFLDNYHFIAYI